jgi:tetratricopeptide (TPR) repeat protein
MAERKITPGPTPQELPGDELAQLKAFLDKNGRLITWALFVALLVVLGVVMYRRRTEEKRARAMDILATGTSHRDFETVIDKYASTPAAPWALLRLAKTYYDSANFTTAEEKYAEFKERFPSHEMAPAAELGRVQCWEASGRMQEALDGYTAFTERHRNHFLMPQAQLGQGRCLEALGRFAEAKALYEDFLAQRPDSGWAQGVEALLTEVTETMESMSAGPSSATNALPIISLPSVTNALSVMPVPSATNRPSGTR